MGRKGNTLAIKSDYGIVLPCTGEPHTFRGERARKLFLRLHCKKCQICRDAEKPAEERWSVCVPLRVFRHPDKFDTSYSVVLEIVFGLVRHGMCGALPCRARRYHSLT